MKSLICRVDPVGVELLHAPNSVWYMDGYHKLIRWNVVVHGRRYGYTTYKAVQIRFTHTTEVL